KQELNKNATSKKKVATVDVAQTEVSSVNAVNYQASNPPEQTNSSRGGFQDRRFQGYNRGTSGNYQRGGYRRYNGQGNYQGHPGPRGFECFLCKATGHFAYNCPVIEKLRDKGYTVEKPEQMKPTVRSIEFEGQTFVLNPEPTEKADVSRIAAINSKTCEYKSLTALVSINKVTV